MLLQDECEVKRRAVQAKLKLIALHFCIYCISAYTYSLRFGICCTKQYYARMRTCISHSGTSVWAFTWSLSSRRYIPFFQWQRPHSPLQSTIHLSSARMAYLGAWYARWSCSAAIGWKTSNCYCCWGKSTFEWSLLGICRLSLESVDGLIPHGIRRFGGHAARQKSTQVKEKNQEKLWKTHRYYFSYFVFLQIANRFT